MVLCSGSAYSLGISSMNKINFEPNLNQDHELCVRNTHDTEFPVKLSVSGPFEEYITLKERKIVLRPLERRCMIYNVHMPNKVTEYGWQHTKIQASQLPGEDPGMFQTLESIKTSVAIFVPYPDKHVEIIVYADDVNENEPINIRIKATNFGDKDVKSANARLDINGADDYENFVTSLYTDTKPINSLEDVYFYTTFDTFGLAPGYYQIMTHMFYDGNRTEREKIVKIGTLYVRINDYTRFVEPEKISEFHVKIESRWNNKIQEIYSRTEFEGIKPIVTPTFELKPWEKMALSGFIDLTDYSGSNLPGQITLFYVNHTTEEEITLLVEEKVVEIEEPEIVEPVIEEHATIPATTIMLIVILVLVIADLIYLKIKKKWTDE